MQFKLSCPITLICFCVLLHFSLSSILQTSSPKDCILTKCPDEAQKCLADPKCEPALTSCLVKCGTEINQTCWTLCLGGKASLAAIPVAICAYNHNCLSDFTDTLNYLHWGNPQLSCLAANCRKPLSSCLESPQCFKHIEGCQSRCLKDLVDCKRCFSELEEDIAGAYEFQLCSQVSKCWF